MLVAIVDDDASVRRGVSRLLRSAALDVLAYESGEAFISSPVPVDLVVLDIHLGGISGFEVREALLRSGRHPGIIFITAHDEAETREGLRRAGNIVCLHKPFDGEVLLEYIRRALDSRPGAGAAR